MLANLGIENGSAFLLHNLGLTTRKQGNYLVSEQYSLESLSLAQQIGIPQITCYILYEFGNLHIDQNQIEQAQNNFDEMLITAPEGGQDLIALAQYGLARVAGINGRLEEARQLGEQSVKALESMGRREVQEVKGWLHSLLDNTRQKRRRVI